MVERRPPTRTGQQAEADEHLEPVADAEHGPAVRRERADRVGEDVGELEGEQRARTEGVGERETAGHDHEPGVGEQTRFLTERGERHDRRRRARQCERLGHVAVAVRAGRGEHDRPHVTPDERGCGRSRERRHLRSSALDHRRLGQMA